MKEMTNNKGFELYTLLSDVNERYVAEALDESVAQEIRAKNRRKRIQMRSAFAACAAVLVLVVGIAVMPEGRLERNDAAIAAESRQSDQAGVSEFAAQRSDAAGDADGAEETTAGSAGDNAANAEAAETADETEADETPDTDGAAAADGIGAPQSITADEADPDRGGGPGEPERKVLTASDGTVYAIASQSSSIHKGKFADTADQGILYEFDNFPVRAIALAQIGDEFALAVNEDYTSETFEGLFRDFGFRYYLHSDSVSTPGNSRSYSDYEFQSEVWGLLFAAPESCAAVNADELPEEARVRELTFALHLGTADEDYCPVEISLNSQGYMFVSVGGGMQLWFENVNAGEIIALFGEK